VSFDRLITFAWWTVFFERFDSSTAQPSLQSRFTYTQRSDMLVIVFPLWRGGQYQINRFLRRFHRAGTSTLLLTFPQDILSINTQDTLLAFQALSDQARQEIKTLQHKYQFTRITVVAFSLGVVWALQTIKDFAIERLTMVVPGSCLASSLWDGIRTQRLKQMLERNNMTKTSLVDQWKTLAPVHNIDAVRAKEISIVLSRADQVIPYRYGNALAEHTACLFPNVTIKENDSLGHYLTISRFCLTEPVQQLT
jgi:fermentation-respiration switch protein FrsA (DUF1100 family)